MRPKCNCPVAHLPECTRWSLHYGAHALDCPVYSPSLDPVDAMHDARLRRLFAAHPPQAQESPLAYEALTVEMSRTFEVQS
jgi:hypothetical protein